MIFKNNNKIANIYRGTLKISNVYRGGILVHTGEKPITYDGLTFEALEPSTIKYTPSTVATAQYSYDTVNWNSADNVTLNLNTGDKVFFKGTITGNQTFSNYSQFSMSGKVAASGSIMSLQAGDPEDKSLNYKYEFYRMFFECTSLVTAPVLPATTLAINCYRFMLFGCTSLTNAPELPAKTLTEGCYVNMFNGCSNLNYIKALFTDTPSSTYTGNWVSGVAPTGTFVKNKDATWDVTGVYGIPEGWTVETA